MWRLLFILNSNNLLNITIPLLFRNSHNNLLLQNRRRTNLNQSPSKTNSTPRFHTHRTSKSIKHNRLVMLRPIVWNFIWKKIGNRMNTSLWYDKWNKFDPLANRISPRDIHRVGLNLQSKVSDVIFQGTWIWPPNLLVKYPFLIDYNILIRDDVLDCLEWRNHHGIPKKFTVSQVWMDIRYRDSKVSWYNMVWFPYCIPRHAFNLWLIVRKKLTTQDLIPVWDRLASLGTVCSLCESIPDSHEHLFFECSFAHGVWDRLKLFAGLDSSNPNIYDIIQSILPIAKRRTMKSVVAKIVVAATVIKLIHNLFKDYYSNPYYLLLAKKTRNHEKSVIVLLRFLLAATCSYL
ncbi:reverse transcriptase domain, reverse transcriptase zinc-binding domain protein [Tanacetum coccineum]